LVNQWLGYYETAGCSAGPVKRAWGRVLLGLWLEDVDGTLQGHFEGVGVSEGEIPFATNGNLLLGEA